jgi:hypothetical protein
MHPTLMLMFLEANRADRDRQVRADRAGSARLRTRQARRNRS